MTMSGFELNRNWDVDNTAESLNNSMFGNPKTKKKVKKSGKVKAIQDFDNDDEKLSKKEKKKLKEKRRKLNKSRESSDVEKTEGKVNKKKNTILVNNETDKNKKSPLIDNTNEIKPKSKNKHKKKKVDKVPNKADTTSEASFNGVEKSKNKHKKKTVDKVPNKADTTSEASFNGVEKSKNKHKKKKVDKVPNKADTTSEASFNGVEKSKNKHKKKKVDKVPNKTDNTSETSSNGVSFTETKRKRKRSLSKDSDSANKSKKVKLDKDQETENKTENNAAPAVERKKRKKKNTSKKNREKQLALKNKPKASLAVIVRESSTTGPEAGSSKTVDSHENVLKNVAQSSQSQANHKKNHKKKKKKKISQDITADEALQTNGIQNTNTISESKLNAGKKKSKKRLLKDTFENLDTSAQDGLLQKTPVLKKKKKDKKDVSEENMNNSKLLPDPGLKKKDKKSKKKQKKMNGGLNNVSGEENPLEYQSPKKKKFEKKNMESAKESQQENSEKKSDRKLIQEAEAPPSGQSLWDNSALGTKARDKLKSARFRFINEQLYTCTGEEALQMFRKDREAFQVYHKGYENQVSKWPVNPVDLIIRQLKSKPVNLVIADFGCGDAKLAASLPHTVHSFDLVAVNDRVTVCDMSKTPLPNESVDVAVFCLSLMGTNIGDYILEANRILKDGGLLKIVEVVSRFKGVSEFIGGIYKRGFQLLNKRDVNEMFYQMDFKKVKTIKKSSSFGIMKLNPCLYKKR